MSSFPSEQAQPGVFFFRIFSLRRGVQRNEEFKEKTPVKTQFGYHIIKVTDTK